MQWRHVSLVIVQTRKVLHLLLISQMLAPVYREELLLSFYLHLLGENILKCGLDLTHPKCLRYLHYVVRIHPFGLRQLQAQLIYHWRWLIRCVWEGFSRTVDCGFMMDVDLLLMQMELSLFAYLLLSHLNDLFWMLFH